MKPTREPEMANLDAEYRLNMVVYGMLCIVNVNGGNLIVDDVR